MDDIVVESQWTRSQFFRANRLGQNWWPEVMIAACAIVLALLNHHHVAWALGGAVAVAVICAASFWIFPTRIWSQGIGVQEPHRTTINDDGIRMKSDSLEAFVGWSRFHRSREVAEFYFLRPKRSLYSLPIRKASFTSPQDEADFRVLLRAHTVAALKKNPRLDSVGRGSTLPL